MDEYPPTGGDAEEYSTDNPVRLPGGEPVHWVGELPGEPRRHTLLRREPGRVILRELDPGEPEPERVPIYEGETVELANAFHSISTHTSPTVGDSSGFLFSLRLKFVRREPGKVVARTLRTDERDDGSRVHVAATDQLVIENIVAELDQIDTLEQPTSSGHVPLAPTLAVWFSLFEQQDSTRVRYLMAAARRLDAANVDAISAYDSYQALDDSMPGPVLRRTALELLSRAETVVIGLGRVIDMVVKAPEVLSVAVEIPNAIGLKGKALREIRNAVEHIEDRARGMVWEVPTP